MESDNKALDEILGLLGEEDVDGLKDKVLQLQEENRRLKSTDTSGLTFKVSQKGGVSVYGLGRFPVTLYKGQWLRLLAQAQDIKHFISQNEDLLTDSRAKRKG